MGILTSSEPDEKGPWCAHDGSQWIPICQAKPHVLLQRRCQDIHPGWIILLAFANASSTTIDGSIYQQPLC